MEPMYRSRITGYRLGARGVFCNTSQPPVPFDRAFFGLHLAQEDNRHFLPGTNKLSVFKRRQFEVSDVHKHEMKATVLPFAVPRIWYPEVTASEHESPVQKQPIVIAVPASNGRLSQGKCICSVLPDKLTSKFRLHWHLNCYRQYFLQELMLTTYTDVGCGGTVG